MLTTKYVKENLEAIRQSLKKRRNAYPVDELLKLDVDAKKLKAELQTEQAKINKASLDISEKKKRSENADEAIAALKGVKDRIATLESELASYDDKINKLLWNLPNILDESVPEGDPPADNKILSKWGEAKTGVGLNHEEILIKLGLLDMERAAKTAGSRFYFLKGDMVLLEQALLRYALDKLAKKGFTPILPPFMLKKKYYRGVAPLGVFEDALYRISEANEAAGMKEAEHIEDELFLISTAEHALASMHAEEIIPSEKLPLKYGGISPSFRREAGAHGKDTKGIFRVHQFNKVEQFIYCKKEDEGKYFEELLANSQEFMQELEIPYQLVLLCSGDTGHQMAKTIDFEGYFPGQKAYRELGSCSTASIWQSIRLDIRYEEKGERKYVYTLNNTAISAERTIACIVENYANTDGTITVPDVLVSYLGKSKIG